MSNSFSCPACGHHLTVTAPDPAVDAPEPLESRYPGAVDDVRDFFAGRKGRFVAAELRAEYNEVRRARGWVELSPKAFGQAMQAIGATSWRTESTRGWQL